MTIKETLKDALRCSKGDDLERAEKQFRGINEEGLNRKYGHSGQTVRQVLDGYRADRAEWQKAWDFVNSLPDN